MKLMRSVEAVQRDATGYMGKPGVTQAPAGWVYGPFPGTEEHVKKQVLAYTTNTSTGGGGWSIVKSRTRASTLSLKVDGQLKAGGKGRIRGFSCAAHRSMKCLWHVDFEETEGGWTFLRGCFDHNHDLMETSAEVLARSTGRYFPDECLETGRVLARSGMKAPQIYDVFVTMCTERGFPVTFDKRDVYNQFKRLDSDVKTFDATRLIESLGERVSCVHVTCLVPLHP